MKKLILLIVALGVMVGCNPNKVYYDDSHNHNQVIIVEDNGYDPYYYEFYNNFQEFCYGEGTSYPTTTCWVEHCFDHWLGGGWYVWDEWCE